MPPQARDLAVPPLVGRQRRAAEREPQRERERAGERWGPAREDLDLPLLAAMLVVAAAALAGGIWLFGLALTPGRFLLCLLAPAAVLRRTRRYLLDFVPFVLLILLYAELRGLVHVVRPHPFYAPQVAVDRFLFGGSVPTVDLQRWLFDGHLRPFDRFVVGVTRVHSLVPSLLAFALWLRRRALFYRFAATMLVLSFGSALVFLVYPAAPPWAASNASYITHVSRIGPTVSVSVPLDVAVPQLKTEPDEGLSSLYSLLKDNPYAAIPSLHAGYSFLCFLFVASLAWRTRWRWWAAGIGALYPLAQSFAAVYTGNHYVFDLLLGYLAATLALVAVSRYWRWRSLPE